MTFVHINHIDEVLPYIKGRDFIVTDKTDYKIINYSVTRKDTFPVLLGPNDPNKVLYECRGLAFYPDGRIMSRPFHKFFNYREREDTKNFPFEEAYALEKMDGSMIRPIFFSNGSWKLGTKMGLTDTANNAQLYIDSFEDLRYHRFINESQSKGLTPIFEWCSRKNRIVVDYPQDQLVLTAIRGTKSGEYMWMCSCEELANKYEIPIVKSHNFENTIDEIVNLIRAQTCGEGIVFRSWEGEMVKVKADQYCLLHKTKDLVSREKDVIELILTEKLDDLKPLLLPEEKIHIEVFENDFWAGLHETAVELKTMIDKMCHYTTKKEFAVTYANTQEGKWKPLLFHLYDKSIMYSSSVAELQAELSTCIKYSTQQKVDDSRWIFRAKW